jgi:hypothetical protein
MRFCAETDDMAESATGANPNGSGSPSPRSAKGSKTVLTPLKWDVRGRDASYLAPPAQIRTGPIRAYGLYGAFFVKEASRLRRIDGPCPWCSSYLAGIAT